MNTPISPAVKVALAHINAWSNHDWETTRALLAPNVHTLVSSTLYDFGTKEFAGIDKYIELKMRGAQLVEPGSVQVLSAIGDDSQALTLIRFKIAMGPGGAMVTMARSILYSLDGDNKIKDERDTFFIMQDSPA